MQVTSRYTAAIQSLLCIAYFEGKRKMTSSVLAQSTGADATIMRKMLSQLQNAGIIEVTPGVGGSHMAKPLRDITLLDVFEAIEANDTSLFRYYRNLDESCPVAQVVHPVVDPHLAAIEKTMFDEMDKVTLKTLYDEMLLRIKEGKRKGPLAP